MSQFGGKLGLKHIRYLNNEVDATNACPGELGTQASTRNTAGGSIS